MWWGILFLCGLRLLLVIIAASCICKSTHASVYLLVSLGWVAAAESRSCGREFLFICSVNNRTTTCNCTSESIILEILQIFLKHLILTSHISWRLLGKALPNTYTIRYVFVLCILVFLESWGTCDSGLRLSCACSFIKLLRKCVVLRLHQLEGIMIMGISSGARRVKVVVTWLMRVASEGGMLWTTSCCCWHRLLFWIHIEWLFACYILKI